MGRLTANNIFLSHVDDLLGSPLYSDFVRYYNLNLFDFLDEDHYPTDNTILQLLSLIAFLPEESQTKILENGGPPFTFSDIMLSRIEHLNSINLYSKRKKGSTQKAPELILPEYIKEQQERIKKANEPERINIEEMEPEEFHQYLEDMKNQMDAFEDL